MISKSFSRLHVLLKISNQIHHSAIYQSSKLPYPKFINNNLTFKQSYQITNNFEQLKKNFEKHFNPFNQQKDDTTPPPPKPQTQIKKPQVPKLSPEIIKIAKQLEQQQSYFITPLYHTRTFHYASYLLSAVRLLAQRKAFSNQNVLKTYFRQVKNSINSNQTKVFTPKSALKLLEEYSIIDFDGDESLSLDKIVDYVEKNYNEFSQIELENLRVAYKEIMVNKAFGPVKFRPLNIQKKYKCQTQRKANLVKEKLIKKLKISNPQFQKVLSVDFYHSKRWFTIKLLSKNLFIQTYPNSFNLLSEDEIYHYIYDMKQLFSASRARASLIKFQKPINIEIRQFSKIQNSSDYETFIEQGIVYQKKIQVIDEMQKIKEMRKLSLKEQIQRMNEKKKALKQKQKNKGKQVVIPQETKQLLGHTKSIDFIQTLKYHLSQLNDELLQKLTKRSQQKRKTTRKQKKLQNKHQQENQQLEDQNDEQQEEQIPEQIGDEKEDSEQPKEDLRIYKNDPFKLKLEFRQKMSEEFEKYKRVVEEMKKKQAQKKKARQKRLQLAEVLTVNHIHLDTKNSIQRLLNNHTIQQLKEFTAYINLIDSLQKVITEIETDILLETNRNLKKQILQKHKAKNCKSRFQLIKNELNEPLDTKVCLDLRFDQIFGNEFAVTDNEKARTKKVSQNSHEDAHNPPKLLILSEQELLNALEFSENDSFKKSQPQKRNKKMTQTSKDTKDSQSELKEKEKILNIIFRHQVE